MFIVLEGNFRFVVLVYNMFMFLPIQNKNTFCYELIQNGNAFPFCIGNTDPYKNKNMFSFCFKINENVPLRRVFFFKISNNNAGDIFSKKQSVRLTMPMQDFLLFWAKAQLNSNFFWSTIKQYSTERCRFTLARADRRTNQRNFFKQRA